jgi:hypothetical protein
MPTVDLTTEAQRGIFFFVYRELPIDENNPKQTRSKPKSVYRIVLEQNIFVCPALERDKQKIFSVTSVPLW